jgi:hypothetical protein
MLVNNSHTQNKSILSNFRLELWQATENYTTLGSKQIRIEKVDANHAYACKLNTSSPWLKTALKIISYVTIILPLLALMICSIHRHKYPLNFSDQTGKDQPFSTPENSTDNYVHDETDREQPFSPPGIFTNKFVRNEIDRNIKEQEVTKTIEDSQLISKNNFIKYCPDGDEIERRYKLYTRILKVNSEFNKKFSFSNALSRKLKAAEIFIRNAPKENLETITRFLEIAEELANGNYEREDVQRIFKTVYSTFKVHPTIQDFSTLFKEIDFKNTCSELKANKKPLVTEAKCRRTLFVLTNKTEENFAKVIQRKDSNEIAAYRLTQLMATNIVPMTLASNEGQTVQKFLNGNVKLLYDFLNENADAAEILSSISVHYVHLYLLQSILIGQSDGHLNNTFVELNENGTFNEFIDFDNEESLLENYYVTGDDHEGAGFARIGLMGLGQAKQKISRALLLLMVAPEFQQKMLYFFKNNNGYAASKERLGKLQKIAQFSLENNIPVSFEDIYFCLFTHEDKINKQRQKDIPDLVNFVTTKGYSDSIVTKIKQVYKRVSPMFFNNLEKLPKPTYHPLRKDSHEQYGGENTIRNVRKWLTNPPTDDDTITVFKNLKPEEADISKYKDTSDPVLTSLCLKGTPGVSARRISREFPYFPMRIVNTDDGYSLILEMNENMKTAKKHLHENKELIEVDEAFSLFFRYRLRRTLEYIKYGIDIKDLKFFPDSIGKWMLLWVGNQFKKNCFEIVKSDGKHFLKINWE